MSTLDQIYEILVGQKIYAGGAWHVYDANGVELSDPAGVMWRANPGALIMWPREIPVAGRRPKRNARFEPYRPQDTVPLAQLNLEDELATDFLLALVAKGFFDGNFRS